METKKLQSFKDLKVWQKTTDLATLIYKITEKFPRSELYGLTNQMRRAVISISSNIAEGFKRNHKKEKLQFYNVAYGSTAELESQIEISYKLTYLPEEDYKKLLSLTVEVAKMIDGLIKSVRKPSNPKFYLLFLLIFLYSISYILIPSLVEAAVLYLEPPQGEYYQGDTFIVEARIDTEEDCINTVEANLSFSQDVLEAVDFSKGNSILILWVKEPSIDQNKGEISFSGGIPGGYCGILPGEPGKINLLGRIAFKTKELSEKKQAEVNFLEGSQVLLNDGLGTPAKLTTKGAVFTILAEKLEIPEDEWKKELEKDNIPPEPFEIEVHQDPAIFEGKYFIIFSTTDKQTGIDYYEILETRDKRQEVWERGESPYLLTDQSLQSIIKVKAVDKAGNERIAEYLPIKKPLPYWIIILVLVGVGIIWWILRKIRIPKSK